MTYIKEDKNKGIEEGYNPIWINQIDTTPVSFKEVPWINVPQINQSISVEL